MPCFVSEMFDTQHIVVLFVAADIIWSVAMLPD